MIANSIHVMADQNKRFQGELIGTCKTDLKTLWRPYLILMKILGLLDFCGKNSKRVRYLWFFYSLGSLIFLWTQIPFCLWRCKENLHDLDSGIWCIANSLWIVAVVIAKSTFFISNYHKRGLHQFFDLWSSVTVPHKYTNAVHRSLKRYAYTVLIVVVCIIFLRNIVFLMNCMDEELSWTDMAKQSYQIYMIILDVAADGYFALTCYTVGKMYTNLHQQLKDQIANGEMDIEHFCNTYYRITEWMRVADNCFKHYTGSVIFLHMFATGSQMYMVIKFYNLPSSELLSSFKYLYWILDGLLVMMVMCYIASIVHVTAHSPLDTLTKAPTWQLPVPLQNQALSLQIHLSTSAIGFSLSEFRVIRKACLPTLMSGFASYFFLLIQFQQPNSCSNCDVANSTHLA